MALTFYIQKNTRNTTNSFEKGSKVNNHKNMELRKSGQFNPNLGHICRNGKKSILFWFYTWLVEGSANWNLLCSYAEQCERELGKNNSQMLCTLHFSEPLSQRNWDLKEQICWWVSHVFSGHYSIEKSLANTCWITERTFLKQTIVKAPNLRQEPLTKNACL